MSEIIGESMLHVDATPDADYPIRILMAHRKNCDLRYASSTDGKEEPTAFVTMMNELQEKRAIILDNAINILNTHAPDHQADIDRLKADNKSMRHILESWQLEKKGQRLQEQESEIARLRASLKELE